MTTDARLLRYLRRLQAFSDYMCDPVRHLSDERLQKLEKHLDESWSIVDRREEHKRVSEERRLPRAR